MLVSTSAPLAIQTQTLTKWFDRKIVLRDVDLEIPAGTPTSLSQPQGYFPQAHLELSFDDCGDGACVGAEQTAQRVFR